MIFQPSQCFVNIVTLKIATTCHEDGRQNTPSMIFAGDSAPHHFQNPIWHIFLRKNVFILNFQVRGQQLVVCLAEQLWAGQAIGARLYTATNETFAL